MSADAPIWIDRYYANCSGCRLCEIACSLKHEGRIWPEASKVRVFMLVPGVEIPHLCVQCYDYPCVSACPFKALSVNDDTGAVQVETEQCTACGVCIDACPGKVPHMHPKMETIVICDLCDGDPACAEICQNAGFNTLKVITPRSIGDTERLSSRTPEEITEDLALFFYGDTAREVI